MAETKTLDTLFEEHKIAEAKRISDRWDRIWDDYGSYCHNVVKRSQMKTFPEWAKTSKYSLNDKL